MKRALSRALALVLTVSMLSVCLTACNDANKVDKLKKSLSVLEGVTNLDTSISFELTTGDGTSSVSLSEIVDSAADDLGKLAEDFSSNAGSSITAGNFMNSLDTNNMKVGAEVVTSVFEGDSSVSLLWVSGKGKENVMSASQVGRDLYFGSDLIEMAIDLAMSALSQSSGGALNFDVPSLDSLTGGAVSKLLSSDNYKLSLDSLERLGITASEAEGSTGNINVAEQMRSLVDILYESVNKSTGVFSLEKMSKALSVKSGNGTNTYTIKLDTEMSILVLKEFIVALEEHSNELDSLMKTYGEGGTVKAEQLIQTLALLVQGLESSGIGLDVSLEVKESTQNGKYLESNFVIKLSGMRTKAAMQGVDVPDTMSYKISVIANERKANISAPSNCLDLEEVITDIMNSDLMGLGALLSFGGLLGGGSGLDDLGGLGDLGGLEDAMSGLDDLQDQLSELEELFQ